MCSLSETVVLVPPQLVRPAGRVGEIDKRIFGLGGPVRRKAAFETDAGSSARLRGVRKQKRAGSLEIAAGAIEKNAVQDQPARPRTVASQLLCVAQPTNVTTH